jgi:hypothetical protein
MKYLAAAVALLAFTPAMLPPLTSAANAVEMPKELRGIWCWKEDTAQTTIYRRCREIDGSRAVGVSPDKFAMGDHGVLCTPLAITLYNGSYFVRVRCYDTKQDTPLGVGLQQWRLFKYGLRLEIRTPVEETNGK